MKKIIILFFVLLSLSNTIFAKSDQEIRQNYEDAKKTLAEETTKFVVEKTLGSLWEWATSTRIQNLQKKAKDGWFFSGSADARNELGFSYEVGYEVPIDYGKALGWYYLAAKQDHARAQYNLGRLYFYGAGVEADLEQAKVWLSKASTSGVEEAKAFLANMSDIEKIKENSPKVIKVTPSNGSQNVLCDNNKLVFEFDRAMHVPQGEEKFGVSYRGPNPFCGYGKNEFSADGKKLTVTLKELTPDRDYVIYLNDLSHMHLKDESGNFLYPFCLKFKTFSN